MPTTTLRLTDLTVTQVRAAMVELSQNRDRIPTYNNASNDAPWWAPVVHCSGPGFTLYTPVIPSAVAQHVLRAVETAEIGELLKPVGEMGNV